MLDRFMLCCLVAVSACGAGAADPGPVRRATTEAPACREENGDPGAWPRAAGFARAQPAAKRPGSIVQAMAGDPAPSELRFFGTHVFDLLDKLTHEGNATDDRRRLACTVLNAVARAGAPVVRLWGSLKRTGDAAEVDHAADALELLLDENGRRSRPLRFVVTLLNHQAGYGTPQPEASLDDQDPESGWSARGVYLEDGWRALDRGQIADRIERFAARERIRTSPYVIVWELVNELDTFRVANGGSFTGAESDRLRDAFLVPATELLASRFQQPIAIGELRGHPGAAYVAWATSVVAGLSADARSRLVWTSHVYAPKGGDLVRATVKLDDDLAIASGLGVPFFVGEVGQHVSGATSQFCAEGPAHDLDPLFGAVLERRRGSELRGAIDKAFFWGEGLCDLIVQHPGRSQPLRVGAGGDTADLAPGDGAARAAVLAQRKRPRFELARTR